VDYSFLRVLLQEPGRQRYLTVTGNIILCVGIDNEKAEVRIGTKRDLTWA
jgi:hypothetical protein